MKLALGTAQFGSNYGIANSRGQVNLGEVKNILRTACNAGIKTLDTAISYGDSEKVLGIAGVSNWDVVTKVPEVPDIDNISEWLFDKVQDSLNKLQVNSIYGLLLHRPEQLNSPCGQLIWQALEEVKSVGLVKKLGVSIYKPEELNGIQQFKFDIVQAPVNLVDRSLEKSGWALKLEQRNIEIHARSIFLQGLLLLKKEDRPKKFLKWKSFFDEFDNWLGKENLLPVEAAVNYVNSLSYVNRLVVGVDSNYQLEQIINHMGKKVKNVPEFKINQLDLFINPSKWSSI